MYIMMPLKIGLILCLYCPMVLAFSPLEHMTSLITGLCPNKVTGMGYSHGVALKFNQKAVGCNHNVYITVTSMGMSCQDSNSYSSHVLWLGNIDNYW